jgi:hypothetical protein
MIESRHNIVRFQDSPWYVKLWRYRYYIPIPYSAVRTYILDGKALDLSFANAWGIAVGMAQVKMHWYYDWNDFRDEFLKSVEIINSESKKIDDDQAF